MAVIRSGDLFGLIRRTLNCVDKRLVDHGLRVALIVERMLAAVPGLKARARQDVCVLALLHDIGAYKTEEIDRMVQFETEDVWSHAIYGYLFLRHLSPLSERAEALLYHHQRCDRRGEGEPANWRLAQVLHLADRVDMFLQARPDARESLPAHLDRARGTIFEPWAVDLFWRAAGDLQIWTPEAAEAHFSRFMDDWALTEAEVEAYLYMLIFAIDFRSYYTVTHTVTTTHISNQAARLMGLDEAERRSVFYGAMLHDLGKIGIPVEILEYPGKLSSQAMQIMRTHVDITERIFGGRVDRTTAEISLRHHEKLDGSGYPRGLDGARLTAPQRIVAVADIVSALCGTRSYKEAYPQERVAAIIGQMARSGQIDARIVQTVIENFEPIMSAVRERTQPVVDLYHAINSEYRRLMQKFA